MVMADLTQQVITFREQLRSDEETRVILGAACEFEQTVSSYVKRSSENSYVLVCFLPSECFVKEHNTKL